MALCAPRRRSVLGAPCEIDSGVCACVVVLVLVLVVVVVVVVVFGAGALCRDDGSGMAVSAVVERILGQTDVGCVICFVMSPRHFPL